jgi:hypothetical protein
VKNSNAGTKNFSLRCDFQVLSMSEELRRALYASNAASLDIELFVPDLVGVTEILSEEHRKKLCRHLPARAEGNKYSTFGIYLLRP